jgi:hypothetical protein
MKMMISRWIGIQRDGMGMHRDGYPQHPQYLYHYYYSTREGHIPVLPKYQVSYHLPKY